MLNITFALIFTAFTNAVKCFNFDEIVSSNVRYYFYHGSSSTIYNPSNFPSIINNVYFDQEKSTTFYIYGTFEGIWVPNVNLVKNAYLKNGNHNFIIVGNQNPFLHVFKNSPIIAQTFAVNLSEFLEISGYETSKINFVAFSLGAKAIAPLTSRILRKITNDTNLISRIVALDPGIVKESEKYLVWFQNLNENDAQFVMTIHTNCNEWGSKEKHGHVEFKINGGCQQPACSYDLVNSLCNHLMAPIYWAEAVKSDSRTAFKSRQCMNYKHYLMKKCDLNLPVAYIGLYTPNNLNGTYYVKTNKVSPYSRS